MSWGYKREGESYRDVKRAADAKALRTFQRVNLCLRFSNETEMLALSDFQCGQSTSAVVGE